MRATLVMASLVLGSAGHAKAVPFTCITEETAPFLQQLLVGGGTPAYESAIAGLATVSNYNDLLEEAIAFYGSGETLDSVRQDDAEAMAEAAIACLPRARNDGDREATESLAYLAVVALQRLILTARDPTTRTGAADLIIQLGDGEGLTAGGDASRAVDAAKAAAYEITRNRPRALDRPTLSAIVNRALARAATPGEQLIEDYLNLVRAPLRDTVDTLSAAALALETARSVTEDLIAKPIGSSGVRDQEETLLSKAEHDLLGELRDEYHLVFGQEIVPRATAVPTTLLTLRATIEQAGVPLGEVREQCFTRAAGSGCTHYPDNAFYTTTYPPNGVADFVPLADMDAELRPLAGELATFVKALEPAAADTTDEGDPAAIAVTLQAIADAPTSGQPEGLTDILLDPLVLDRPSKPVEINSWCGPLGPAALAPFEGGDFAVRLQTARSRLNEIAAVGPQGAALEQDRYSLGAVCNLVRQMIDSRVRSHAAAGQGGVE